MAKREGFTMNELNPRDKIIIDFLKTQFNKSDFIKDVLYEYIVSNNLQISTQPLQKNNVTNTKKCIKDDDKIYTNIQKDNVRITTNTHKVDDNIDKNTLKDNNNSDEAFAIDLSAIDDEEVNITTDVEKEDATTNAMDFLLKM